MIRWEDVFSKDGMPWSGGDGFAGPVLLSGLADLKRFLDAVHIRHCLVKPYQEHKSYPLVEKRELLPSFDNDMFEHKDLPGFALVALERPLEYFSEIFQYDKLRWPEEENPAPAALSAAMAANVAVLASRLPRRQQDDFRRLFSHTETSCLENYPHLLHYLLNMDRAHVLAMGPDRAFRLAGVFASFPSDIDSELKRFGMRIGKFVYGDNEMYERNRAFVYQYLMELYGFPIVSERRTSSALFARKLHKMGERFLLRVQGQTDRTITTYTADGGNRRYPLVEKIALIAVDEDQREAIDEIERGGFFLDRKNRVIIIRITYRQHRFDPSNVRQDRALSIAFQDVLHPLTGEALSGINIVKDTSNMFLRLTDIVRGEYMGSILYRRTERVENTDTDEKRLKFLHFWLTKHQRRMIGYSDEFFSNVVRVLSGYLYSPDNDDAFDALRDLHNEVDRLFKYIQQARKVRILEDLAGRTFKGERVGYRQMLVLVLDLLNDIKFEALLLDDIVENVEKILSDRYLRRTYIEIGEERLTRAGQEIRKHYGRLVALQDDFKALRKARAAKEREKEAERAAAPSRETA